MARDGGSFPSVSLCSEPTFSSVAVTRDVTTASSLADTVITCVTVSRSGTATTSSTIPVLVGVPRWSVRLFGELAVYATRKPVVM